MLSQVVTLPLALLLTPFDLHNLNALFWVQQWLVDSGGHSEDSEPAYPC